MPIATPNFADTYNPVAKLLHDGPDENSHLTGSSAAQPADLQRPAEEHVVTPIRGFLASTEPRMPPLRRMHEIGVADPRAQA